MNVEKKLINWRKAILKSIKSQIREILGARPDYLDRYYLRYKHIFEGKYQRIKKEILFDKIENSKLIFLADYHTLQEAQKFHLEVLKFLNEKNKDLNLYLEPYAIKDQKILEDFFKGKINEEYFLYKIKYKKRWGFEWENYKEILQFAKENNIKVYGINLEKDASCEERDIAAAEFISKKIKEEKDKIHIVIIGDLHLAPEHLPEKIFNRLKERIAYIIVYQNSETIYLKEMEKGKEKDLNIVKIDGNSFCVFNTPPWVKYQTWLTFLLRSKVLNVEEKNLDDLAEELLLNLSSFFGKKWECQFEVKTFDEFDFLINLLNIENSSPFFMLLQENYSFFVPYENIIYIPFPDLLRFVEEIAHFIFYEEKKWESKHIFLEENFLERINYYAFGYFFSKLLFEERKTQSIKELKNLLQKKSDERAEKKLQRLKTAVPYIIKVYKNFEKEKKANKFLTLLDENLCFTISRRVGYLLGEKWFKLFKKGQINCNEILQKIRKM